jgi:hemolysin activation/secretion protein
VHQLPEDMRFSVFVRGQTSFNAPLFGSEQFALDGPQSVSGFESGSFSVDDGILARSELSRSFSLPDVAWVSVVTPYVFGAAGRGWLVAPTILEPGIIDVASVGLGARAFVEGPDGWPASSVSLELARRFTDDPRVEEGYRVMFNAGAKF